MSAIGGVYVPVNDAAVTLNTGFLVYQQCVLREVIARQKEGVEAGILKKVLSSIETGRGGNAQYVKNIPSELLSQAVYPSVAADLSGSTFANIRPTYQGLVKQTVARTIYTATQRPEDVLSCQLPCSEADAKAALDEGDANAFQRCGGNQLLLAVSSNPACTPRGLMIQSTALASEKALQQASTQFTTWNWGNGFYDQKTVDQTDPSKSQTVTPAITVQQSFQTALDAPQTQLNNANDIGQINSPLMNAVQSQVVSDINGLSGLIQPQNGQPSYLDRMTAEASSGLRDSALNAAIQILNAARQVEGGFHDAKAAVADALLSTINSLRSYENQCWNLIIPKAQDYAKQYPCYGQSVTTNTNGQPSCTPTPFDLVIATSTAFSQQVIDSQIAPVATQVAGDVKSSEKALQALNQLIAGVTNTNSLTAQRTALEQLDTLTSQKVLHNQYDLTAAQKQQQDAQTALTSLLDDTKKAWADSTDPNVGWCNINNTNIIKYWAERWRKK
jgi:hypothetical protein